MKTKKYLIITLLSFISIMIFPACTRDAGNNSFVSFKVNRSTSGNSTMSLPTGYILSHLVINVSATDIQPTFVYNWDANCHCSANTINPAPSVVTIEVPSGLSRLIQVLGVYQDPTNQSSPMTLAYGEITMSLNPGAQNASVRQTILNTTGGQQSNLTGQYVSSVISGVGYGPTGTVAVKVNPTGASAPMTIFYSEMFNGWYQAFVIDGINLSHIFQDGTVLLSNQSSTTLDSFVATNPNQMMKVVPPATYYENYGGTSSSTYTENGNPVYIGFYGPASTSLGGSMCYPANMTAIPNLYVDLAHTTPLSWNTTGTSGIYRSAGGVAATTTPCTSGTAFVNQMTFSPAAMAYGSDSVGGFKGPFKIGSITAGTCTNSGGSNAAASCYNSSNNQVSVAWSYLPNVFSAGGISGVTMFTLDTPMPAGGGGGDQDAPYRSSSGGGDNYLCSQFASMGFMNRGDFGSSTTTATYTDAIPAGYQAVIFLCPFHSDAAGNRTYFGSAAHAYGASNCVTSCGGPTQNPAVKLVWSGINSSVLNSNACVFAQLEGQDATNNPGYLSNSTSINVTLTSTNATFYQDPNCTSPLSATVTFSPMSVYQNVYFKPSATAAMAVTLGATATGLTSASYSGNTQAAVAATTLGIKMPNITPNQSYTFPKGSCQQLLIQARDASGNATIVPASPLTSLSMSPTTPVYYYSNSACTTAFTSGSFTTSASNYTVYFSVPFSDTSTSINATANASGGFTGTGSAVLSLVSPGPAAKINVMANMTTLHGTCAPATINIADNTGNPAPASANMVVNLTAVSGTQFYNSGACTTPITSTSISAGQSGPPANSLYFMKATIGSDTLTFSDSTNTLQPYTLNETFN